MASALSSGGEARIGPALAYFGGLTLFVYLASPVGYLVDIQTSFLLKNQLRESATQVAWFRVLTAMPVYVAFLFGLARDQWNPLGLRDRGFFLLFAPFTAAAFLFMAVVGVSHSILLVGMLAAMVGSRFVSAAYQGLMALVGQEKLVSGRLTAVWQIVGAAPVVLGAVASGYISNHLSPRITFLLVAASSLLIAVLGLWKPTSVFGRAYEAPQARRTRFRESVKRLLKHRAVYPAVLIFFLWNFAPGSNTPLQFYLSDTLHASDAMYSYFNAIFVAAFIPTFLAYAHLCKRVPLRKLLWWGTLVAVPQMIPLAFIHSGVAAMWLAAPMGLMGGIATAAYYDLAMRSCPPGLQGTLMMLVDSVYLLSLRGGDLLGSAIYNSSPRYGFTYCVIATTIVYALILPVLLLVPREIIANADGEPAEESRAPALN